MGYVISYESLRHIYEQMDLVIESTMNERIPKIEELLTEYINNDRIQGKTADTIKSYLNETHRIIMLGILSVSQQLLTKVLLYQNGYYNIDPNKDTVIDEDYVNFIDEAVKGFIEKQNQLTSNFKVYTNEISDIFDAKAPSDWNIK